MTGWIYLIRNKDLHKIGITENLEQRMKQLKPDAIVSTLETEDFQRLEKELHKRYKDVRIPQTEYFRLTEAQLKDCTERLSGNFEEINRKRRNRLLAIAAVVLVSLIGLIIWDVNSLSSEQLERADDSITTGGACILVGMIMAAVSGRKGIGKPVGVFICVLGGLTIGNAIIQLFSAPITQAFGVG